MDAKKALIITWAILGLLIAGAIGFFIGRSDIGRGMNNLNNVQGTGPGGGIPSGSPGQGAGGNISSPQPGVKK
jgi:hypothetical protein